MVIETKDIFYLVEHPVMEMAKIGTFGSKIGETGNYEVWVYDREGDGIPHFHIVNKQEQFSCCVRILECDYFIHTGKENTLNAKLKKSLVMFLKKPHRKLHSVTNWEFLCACWDDNNSNYELPENIYDNMPNYLNLR